MSFDQPFSLCVLGQGATGLEVARWGAHHLGSEVSSVTLYGGASSAPTEATCALEVAGVSCVYGTEQVAGAFDVCVASPGISEFSPFFASAGAVSAEIMGEPEFAWRLSPERWIAVTGTNGKTTTTSLVDHLLRAGGVGCRAVGNIGTAPIAAVDRREDGSWFAAELSSYQLATTSLFHPRAAVLLNITPDHLAWHRSHENYVAAKLRVFANMGPGDLAVVCADDAGSAAALPTARATGGAVCELALEDTGARFAAFEEDGTLVVRLDGVEHALVRVEELVIAGSHNVLNALAASAVALWTGVADDDVRAGLRSFEPLEHRIEPCGVVGGVRFVNDSKATNTDAVEKALTAFAGDDLVLMLGGSDKGTPLEGLARDVAHAARAVVCFGAAGPRFAEAVAAADGEGRVEIAGAGTLEEGFEAARAMARAGSVVLLSPACASFDEFSGYEERGRRFKALVRACEDR